MCADSLLRISTFLLTALLGLAVPVQAANLFTTESRFSSRPGQAVSFGQFGQAVDHDGQWLVVGAHMENAGPRAEGGAVYVYQRQAGGVYTEYQRLIASDTNLNTLDHFGASVAISGNTIVVGAPEYDGSGTDSGRAYVFEFDTTSCPQDCWNQDAILDDASVGAEDAFGGAVAIDGTTIVVGAENDEVVTTGEGAAYIFIRSGSLWVADTGSPLGPNPPPVGWPPQVQFGGSVAVSGDLVAVGAEGDDTVPNAGAVYIFNRTTGWAQEAKITGQTGPELFGSAIDLDGTTLVVGAPLATVGGITYSGVARVYDRALAGAPWWSLTSTLLPLQADNTTPDSGAFDFFGRAVSIDVSGVKEHIIVGAPDLPTGTDPGSAYLFQNTGAGWGQLAKFNASDAAAADDYGTSVSVDNAAVKVGAKRKDVIQTDDGAVYSYELTDTDDDGLSDALEIKICNYPGAPLCTNINLADTDGDGTSDFDEIMMSDTDGDGFTDGDEWLIGSDPFDPADIPADGDINNDGNVDTADVLLATRMATGLLTPTLEERLRGNVAPLTGGVPAPLDTVIGADDVLLIQRKALGLVNF